MQPRQRAVLVLVGFCLLAAGVVAAIGYLLVADDKAVAAGIVGAVVALLVATSQGVKWLWAHWVDVPTVRIGRPVTAVAVVLALAVVAVGGRALLQGDDADAEVPLTRVDAIVGSEKRSFFADPRVAAAFAEHGFRVAVVERGSRAMAALDTDLAGFDLAFPASVPTSLGIDPAGETSSPFRSPMVIATFEPVAEALERAGLVRREADGSRTFDMAAFVALSAGPAETATWARLGVDGVPPDRPVLVRTTDPWSSSSGAMFLAIVDRVTGDLAGAGRLPGDGFGAAAHLFAAQGGSPATTETLFEAYETRGLDFAPMVFAYEAEFVERALADGGDQVRDDGLAMLYPSPTVVSKHTVVPLSAVGVEVGDLLADDPALRRLAAEHGFRAPGPDFGSLVEGVVPGVRVDIDAAGTIDPPSFADMEALLARLDAEIGAPAGG